MKAAICILILCVENSLVATQSNLVASPMFSTGSGGPGLYPLPHCDFDTVAQEIHQVEFQRLIAAVVNLPEETIRQQPYTLARSGIQVGTQGLSKKQYEALGLVLARYTSTRFAGHSARYALDVLRQRLSEPKLEKDITRAMLFSRFPDVPRDWVQPEPFCPATRWTNVTSAVCFIVLDNGIVWQYWVSLLGTPGGAQGGLAVDAQEYDRALRPKFEAARKQAEQNLAKRKTQQDSQYWHALDREMDSILVQRYGIRRRSFRELNWCSGGLRMAQSGRREGFPSRLPHHRTCGSASGGSWQSLRMKQHSFSATMIAAQSSANRLQRSGNKTTDGRVCLPSSALPEL